MDKKDNIERKIRERAYLIWEQEGRLHGRDVEHWLQAERAVKAGSDTSPAGKRKAAGKKSGRTVRPRKAASPRKTE